MIFRHCLVSFVHVIVRTYKTSVILSMRLFILLFSFVLLPLCLSAQVLNVERFKTVADTFNVLKGSLGFGFNVADQGTRQINLRNDANLSYFSKKHQFLLLNRVDYRTVGDNTTSNGYFHLRGIFYRDLRVRPESFAQFQYNLDLGLQRRVLFGATSRFRLFETPSFRGHISTGVMYENELWKERRNLPELGTENVRIVQEYIKSTTSVNFQGKLHEDVSLVLFGYYQARPAAFFTPRITVDALLTYHLRENLRLGFHFVSTSDFDPVFDAAEFVYSFHNTLIISF